MRSVPAIGKIAPGASRRDPKPWSKALAAPRPRSASPAPSAAAVGCPDGARPGALRVLVVDDEPVNLLFVSAQLQARGLSPWLAADGDEAVMLACDRPFDLILMDLQMPRLDGLQATLAIRRFEAIHRMPAVPVIAYSSRSVSAGELQAHGLNGRLSKPCPAQELDECLARWARAQQTASPDPAQGDEPLP